MLKNALRGAKISPRSATTTTATPFICLFCAKGPALARPLSTTLPALKNQQSKRDAAVEAHAAEKIREQVQNQLREDIRATIARKKEEKEEKRKKPKAGEEVAAAVKKEKKEKKERPKKKKRKQVVREKRKETIRRILPSDIGGEKIEGLSLAAALGKSRSRLGAAVIDPDSDNIRPIEFPNAEKPPALSHDLDRVLFNPGVHYLQDPRSRVYNFDPYLRDIMPVTEFDFNAVDSYITSSRDTKLTTLASQLSKKYVGSTSSMTNVLAHFHFLLSHWRNINADSLSRSFPVEYRTFTLLSRAAAAVFLRYKGNGTYAIDADKEFDVDSILSLLGRSLEKMLTLPPAEYEALRRTAGAPQSQPPSAPDKFHFSTLGDFLMRSQLDAYDARLPGTGMFDLKTRAVVSVRMDVQNFHLGSGYQIKTLAGQWESFEREYFDMIRAAFLKYSLQVRMGRMDGIFVAFHNTERIFGFQYVSLEEMDSCLHEGWGSGIGDREFKASLMLLNEMLNKATERFPEQSLRFHFETRETQTPHMYIIAEPVSDKEIDEIQNANTRDLDEFLKSLEVKRESVQRKAEFKGIAAKFGEVEEEAGVPEETVVEVEVEEGEGAEEAAAEEVVVEETVVETETVQAVSQETEVLEKTQAEASPEPAEEAMKDLEGATASSGSGSGGNDSSISSTSNAAVADEASTNDTDAPQTAQDDADDDDDDTGEEEEEEEEDSDSDSDSDDEEDADEEEEEEELLFEPIPDEHTEKPELDPEVVPLKANVPEAERPILAMTLTTYNLVNGKSVLRPNHLRPDDKWTVEYTVTEAKTPLRAWTTYNSIKTRRRKAVENRGLPEDSDEVNQYVKYLRTLSKAGRTWAAEQEARFAGVEPVVYKGGQNGKKEE